MLLVVWNLGAGTDLPTSWIYQVADGDSYAGLASKMIDLFCIAGSKFAYQISYRIGIAMVGSWHNIVLVSFYGVVHPKVVHKFL